MAVRIRLLGVPVSMRPTALVSPLISAAIVAAAARQDRAALAAASGALWYTADCAHVVGHIISSQAAGAPLDAVDFGLYPKSVYLNNEITPQQHIGRACGGVIASLVAALVLAALSRAASRPLARGLLRIAAGQHALLFALSMLPVPMVDGGVIYANLARLLRESDARPAA